MEEIKICVSGNYRFEIGPNYFAILFSGEPVVNMSLSEASEVIDYLYRNTRTQPIQKYPQIEIPFKKEVLQDKIIAAVKGDETLGQRRASGKIPTGSMVDSQSAQSSPDGRFRVVSEAVVDLGQQALSEKVILP